MIDNFPATGQPLGIALWPAGAPGSEDWDQAEEEVAFPNFKVVRNVTRPTLTAYFPDLAAANGTAVIICPGGAFHFLACEHEGRDVARWLTERGVAAFVLKYRVARTGDDFPGVVEKTLNDTEKMAALMQSLYPLINADGLQAVRMVRAHASEWGLAPGRIGIMGFSAGGVVTANVARLYDASSRPDFAAPIYSAPPPEAPIPADAPPLFILCADDDEMASAVSQQLYAEWKTRKHPVELHIYAGGGHGFGMLKQGLPSDSWIDRFGDWLGGLGFLKKG